MKKLLLLLLLFGVNANGADKPILSVTGLEGIAESGLKIVVEGYSYPDNTFNKEAVENQVKLRLVQAGIKLGAGLDAYLNIYAQPYNSYINLNIQVRRKVTFEANGKTYRKVVTVWETGGAVGKDKLRDEINRLMDKFLLDYLKANPKKKED